MYIDRKFDPGFRELDHIKGEVPSVLKRLEKTVYAAASHVRRLKQAGCGDYADAILNRYGFGGDGGTAENELSRFAPKGSPRPSDQTGIQELSANPERHKAYVDACYERWVKGITDIKRVVEKYGGDVIVNGMPLDAYLRREYLRQVTHSGEPPDKVQVKIFVPGQDKLSSLREFTEK